MKAGIYRQHRVKKKEKEVFKLKQTCNMLQNNENRQ